jgi:UrcA family protein
MKSFAHFPRISGSLVSLALVIGSVCFLGVTAADAYASEWDVPTKTIHYADLDLNTRAGTVQMYRRIRFAAQDVCSPFDRGGLDAKVRLSECEAHAIDSAVAKLDNRNVTAYYLAQNPKYRTATFSSTLNANNNVAR